MSDRTEDTMPWFRETELSTSGYGGYHTYRIPAVAVAPDGTVLAFCEGRRNGHWDFGEINIVLRRSTDGGAAWLPMQLVAARGEETIGNPCVVVDRDTGAVWLAYCRNNDRVQIMRSEDNGASWSEPRDVKPDGWTWYATGPGHGVQLRNGRLLIPCDHREGPRGDAPMIHSHVIYSDDHGSTWKLGGIVEGGTDECQVAETSPGSLYMTIRNADREVKARLYARSGDGGETWSGTAEAEGVIDPICEGSIAALPAPASPRGLLLLANSASAARRENLTVRLSRDEGETWEVSKSMYPGVSAYSDLAAADDNTVLCLYERGTSLFNEKVVLAHFNLEWVTSAQPSLRHWRDNSVWTGADRTWGWAAPSDDSFTAGGPPG